jgi:hypothetical protein
MPGTLLHFFVPYITKHVPYLKKKYYFFLKFLLLYIIYKKNAETSSSTILTNKKTIYWTHYINNICHCFISLIYSQTGFYYYHWVYPWGRSMPPSGSRVRPWLRGHIVPLENDLVNLDLLLVWFPNFKIVSKATYTLY